LEGEGVVPPSAFEGEVVDPPSALEEEVGELEEGFQAALLWLESSAFWSPAWDLASQ